MPIRFALLVSLLPAAASASAADDPPEQRTPPPQAYRACEGKAVGDACAVQLGPFRLEGRCTALEDQRVACKPDKPPSGR